MMVYLASVRPLPLIPWDAARPAFHITELPEGRDAARSQFTLAHAYYAGSHEGCGCGFQYGEYELDDPDAGELAELARHKESRARLAQYLQSALAVVPVVELYACWDGDEGLRREYSDRILPQSLVTDRTFFRERELLLVSESLT
jgi:hypothetical protein